MPDGPLLLSPDRMVKSFLREVVKKQPHIFKIKCLQSIKSLFEKSNPTPFVAGFGNRDTDTISYREVSIDDSKIFIINSKGVVKIESNKQYGRSYSMLNTMVDKLFPNSNSAEKKAEEIASQLLMGITVPYRHSRSKRKRRK